MVQKISSGIWNFRKRENKKDDTAVETEILNSKTLLKLIFISYVGHSANLCLSGQTEFPF